MRLDVPVDLTREQARQLAEVELADPAYRAGQPSLVQRAVAWVIDQVQRVVDRVAEAAPGGWLGILGLVALVAVAVLFLRWRLGPVAGSATVRFRVDPGTSAAEYRARATQRAAAEDWIGAVTERMRALVRQSQERGLIDAQPGWTADEVAAAVSAAMPGAEVPLARAARTFDDVRYGGRPASAQAYATIAAADDLVERARPAAVG